MTGYEYERKCAELLKAKGFTNVTVTPGSGDQGIDVLAKKGGKKYGIQCKYYEGTVGNKAVQEAFAGASFYDCDIAMVITNSKLTSPAKTLAKKLGVTVWEDIDAVYLQKNDAKYIKQQAEKKQKAQERRKAAKEEKRQQMIAEFQQWQSDYPQNKVALREELEKRDAEYAKKRQELDTPISLLKSEKAQLSAKLETTSFFAFTEKSKLKTRLSEIDVELKQLTDSYNGKLMQLEQEHHLNSQRIRTKARQSYPNLVQEAIRASLETKIGEEYPDYSSDILLNLYFSDKPMSGYDLVYQIPETDIYFLLKFLRPLVESKIIVREVENYQALYSLSNPDIFEKFEEGICEEIAATTYTAEMINDLLSRKTRRGEWSKKLLLEQQLKKRILNSLPSSLDGIMKDLDSHNRPGISTLLRELEFEGNIEKKIIKGRTVYYRR